MTTRAGTRAKSQKPKPKSRVNEAGNYTKPTMRRTYIIKSKQVQKVAKLDNGQARKAQMLAKEYKAKGGGYK
jgi:hypothetical protein